MSYFLSRYTLQIEVSDGKEMIIQFENPALSYVLLCRVLDVCFNNSPGTRKVNFKISVQNR